MLEQSITILEEGYPHSVTAVLNNDTIFISPDTLLQALGWEYKPEGLCRDELCIPVPDELGLESEAGIDLVKLAQLWQRPLALDIKERAAYLGAPAQDRAQALTSLSAPDFTLPDLNGHLHSLSEQRGKKVLLVAYASW